MPYKIIRCGPGKYRVVNRKTGKKYAAKCQSKATASAQIRALHANADK